MQGAGLIELAVVTDKPCVHRGQTRDLNAGLFFAKQHVAPEIQHLKVKIGGFWLFLEVRGTQNRGFRGASRKSTVVARVEKQNRGIDAKICQTLRMFVKP